MLIVLTFILAYFVIDMIKVMLTDIDNVVERPKQYLNKKVIINHDTLLIIDYSVVKSTYKLSNGTDISKNIIDNVLLK